MVSFFHSIEFYVILTVVAAAIVALSARPHSPGAVREHLLGSTLIPFSGLVCPEPPSVHLECTSANRVVLVRRGLQDVTMSGSVSIAMKIKAFDIIIEERLTPGSAYDDPAESAMFVIDFLAPGEYYHIHYNSASIGRSATFTFHTRPSLTADHTLMH